MSEGQIKKDIRPIVKYRVELQKRLEINKSYKERRNRAVALRILSYGLFGQKRFQNLYLSCSLNCFYWALQIASFLHQRVAGLAMIIKFDQVHVIEYYENNTEDGKSFGDKKYTKILIKLTKSPTEEDKKQPGYNPGFKSQDIKGQITQALGRKQGSGEARRDNRGRVPRRTENRRNRQDRRDRGDRRDRQDRGDRRRQERTDTRGERRQQQYRRNRPERRQKDEYRERNYPRRQREQQRQRPRRQQKEKYGDDRDQRRVYKQSENQPRAQRYERGERKTRGGSGANYRAQPAQNRERRYEPKREQRSQRVDRQGRGDRRPKKGRYSDDSD